MNKFLCGWCYEPHSPIKDGGSFKTDKVCKACLREIPFTEKADKTELKDWIKRGFKPAMHMFGLMDDVLTERKECDIVLQFGSDLVCTLEIDANHSSYTLEDECRKNKKNEETAFGLIGDPRRHLAIRINPTSGYSENPANDKQPMTRWMILRDMIVMWYRLVRQGISLNGDKGSLVYICYNPKSPLIDETRNPYIVEDAVKFPTFVMEQPLRLFPDWACCMDLMLAILNGSKGANKVDTCMDALKMTVRIALDKVERRGSVPEKDSGSLI
jgi:hypothetical protein